MGRTTKTKPKDILSSKPKHPLTAYNLFFLLERNRIIRGDVGAPSYTAQDARDMSEEHMRSGRRPHRKSSHGKIGFRDLTLTIAARWKSVDRKTREALTDQAGRDRKEYDRQLRAWEEQISEAKPTEYRKIRPVTPLCPHANEEDAIDDEHDNSPRGRSESPETVASGVMSSHQASLCQGAESLRTRMPEERDEQATLAIWIESLRTTICREMNDTPFASLSDDEEHKARSESLSTSRKQRKELYDCHEVQFCASSFFSSCNDGPLSREEVLDFDLLAPLDPEEMDKLFEV